ncbi:hypothetical protein [Nitrospira calida]|jgi:hypothetical protein
MIPTVMCAGQRIPLTTKKLKRGFALAAIRYGWLRGESLPRTADALRRACFSEARKRAIWSTK